MNVLCASQIEAKQQRGVVQTQVRNFTAMRDQNEMQSI